MRYLPVLFLALVAGEIAAFIIVGQRIGVLATLGLLFLSFAGGLALIRSTGLAMNQVFSQRQANAEEAARQATSATFRMVAGLLFIIPGFLTDVAAGLLLVPAVQNFLRQRFAGSFVHLQGGWAQETRRQGSIIEGEAVEIEGEIVRTPQSPKR